RDVDGIAALLGCFNRILVHGGINQAKVVDDLRGLGALAGPQESRNGDGGEQGYDRHYNHDFHEGEAPAFGCEFLEHTRSASFYLLCTARGARWRDCVGVSFSQLIPCHQQADDRRMNRQILSYRATKTPCRSRPRASFCSSG